MKIYKICTSKIMFRNTPYKNMATCSNVVVSYVRHISTLLIYINVKLQSHIVLQTIMLSPLTSN
jgi:hypothetical protein